MVTGSMEGLSSLVKSMQNFLLTDSRYIRLLELTLVVLLGWSLSSLVLNFINERYQPLGSELPFLHDTNDNVGRQVPQVAVSGRVAPAVVRGLFGIPEEQNVSTGTDSIAEENLQETQLNLKLKGVLLNRDNGTRLALIARPGQPEELYHEGDRVDGAEIFRIEPARVILRRNGSNEVLNMDIQKLDMTPAAASVPATDRGAAFGRNGVRTISERERVVSQGTLRRELNNLPRLLQQARAVPYTENGQSMGFRLVSIQANSIFEDLGLRQEDVIRSVNGKQLLTPEDALNAYRDLRTSRSFQVEVLRGGRQVTLSLSVQ